jgi:hypothetical protein
VRAAVEGRSRCGDQRHSGHGQREDCEQRSDVSPEA